MIEVSVILPALSANSEYFRCVYSIKAALSGHMKFEIICVVRDVSSFIGLNDSELHIIQEEESGIYGAMNTGLKKAAGRYIYFIGQDDVLLPSAASAICQGIENSAEMILADVFWGNRYVFKNKASRNTLIWKNWCHQGVFYNRLKFLHAIGEYPVKFQAQADHYINIVFSAIPGLKWTKYCGAIAWYSTDGFSSRVKDLEFRHAFPEIVRKHFGFTCFAVVVLRRAMRRVFTVIKK